MKVRSNFYCLVPAALALMAAASPAAPARPTPKQPPTRLEQATYAGHPAYRISDGRTEAVIVPDLGGRIMSYGFVGGANWLWQSPITAEGKPAVISGGWANWGGDKSWPGPQSDWKILSGREWPPDAKWDGAPYKAQVFPGGSLSVQSPVSAASGSFVTRSFSYNAAGELVIQQRVEKTQGDPLSLSIWSVTQIAPPAAVFLPSNDNSIYRSNYLRMSKNMSEALVTTVAPTILKIVPNDDVNFKMGTDATTAAIAAVRGDAAFVLKTTYSPGGDYPDGPGVAVELFNCKEPKSRYMELELLSPMRPYYQKTAYSQTIRWSLHQMPSTDPHSADTLATVQQLLEAK